MSVTVGLFTEWQSNQLFAVDDTALWQPQKFAVLAAADLGVELRRRKKVHWRLSNRNSVLCDQLPAILRIDIGQVVPASYQVLTAYRANDSKINW